MKGSLIMKSVRCMPFRLASRKKKLGDIYISSSSIKIFFDEFQREGMVRLRRSREEKGIEVREKDKEKREREKDKEKR